MVWLGNGRSRVGLGVLWRSGVSEFLRTLGQRGVQRHTCGLGKSLHWKCRRGYARKFLQSGDWRDGSGGPGVQLQRVHGELRGRQSRCCVQSVDWRGSRWRARGLRKRILRRVRKRRSRIRVQTQHGQWNFVQRKQRIRRSRRKYLQGKSFVWLATLFEWQLEQRSETHTIKSKWRSGCPRPRLAEVEQLSFRGLGRGFEWRWLHLARGRRLERWRLGKRRAQQQLG